MQATSGRLGLAGALLLATLTVCASDSQHGSTHPHHGVRPKAKAIVDVPAEATIRVLAREFGFNPRGLEIRAGEPTRIELRNEGAIEHALVVKTPDGKGDWIHLHAQAGMTDAATVRLNEPGRYPIACTIPGHHEAGMVGELVVRPN